MKMIENDVVFEMKISFVYFLDVAKKTACKI